MQVRLKRKFADILNGVDLSQVRVGDLIDLPLRDGLMLIAEEWATPVDQADVRAEAADQPRERRKRPR